MVMKFPIFICIALVQFYMEGKGKDKQGYNHFGEGSVSRLLLQSEKRVCLKMAFLATSRLLLNIFQENLFLHGAETNLNS